MPERRWKVRSTASFEARLDSIEAFWDEFGAPQMTDRLLTSLRETVIPNLARFPRMGRRYLEHPPQSVEALQQFAALPAGAPDSLRVLLHDDYLTLYAAIETEATVYLLSIRHHRQLSFDFARHWPV